MTWIVAGAMVVSSGIGALSSNNAANTQTEAANQASATQQNIFNQQAALQEPFRQAGIAGQNRQMELLGLGGNTAAQGYGSLASGEFTPANFLANQDPGYAFRMSEGLKALDRSAAARGGLLSGGTLKGIQQYGQGLASGEYQNAFNRYQASRAATLNPLQSLAGQGLTTAANVAGQAGQLGQQLGANYMGAANARASGYMGTANTISSGLGSYLNYSQNQNLINRLGQTPSSSVGAGYTNPANYGPYDSTTGSYPYLG